MHSVAASFEKRRRDCLECYCLADPGSAIFRWALLLKELGGLVTTRERLQPLSDRSDTGGNVTCRVDALQAIRCADASIESQADGTPGTRSAVAEAAS